MKIRKGWVMDRKSITVRFYRYGFHLAYTIYRKFSILGIFFNFCTLFTFQPFYCNIGKQWCNTETGSKKTGTQGKDWKVDTKYSEKNTDETSTCFESSSLHNEYSVMNFLASSRASRKPSATSMISQISSKSGTTMAHGLPSKQLIVYAVTN